MASLKDVARLANVSLMTVSRAINNPELLKPETLKQVQQAIQTLNYVPDFSARKIRGKGSKISTVGVLALDTATTPYSVEVILSIEQTARQFGWSSFVVNITSNEDNERAVRQLLSQRPDGIIYTTMGLREVTIPEGLHKSHLVLANCIDPQNRFPAYIPDDYNGQYQAICRLIEKGYRKPLCLYIPQETVAGKTRREAVESAWRCAGLREESLKQYHLALGDEHYRDVIDLINRHCKQAKPDFDVVVCGNDRIAFLTYQVLLSKGLRIPEDVAVLGYDNMIGVGELFYPPLSTVVLPHYQLGQQAALHIIEQRKNNGTQYVSCDLLDRESL
ncbi:LacI family DNA-binding transcriptional regulator [Providencia vermicola]|uniref:LacI family DNA-binding transcriptional regulator n=2 Tax=Providencia TaxID=586 RepID=A0AAI9MYH6_PROST|nr:MULTISPECIES: LacI family DNA-binding transcriptional regulator [Providencia]ELR5045073.1 LacI family DNA-binding transcriptional regulator [Providencia rettgeri]ELR5037662.1 LacI family DNA-binding transcriptional regulator [Providencia stuartii]ELR5121992.1 LacI family DNA-binding transcriptional regulator [Providencia stuartii]ELR5123473.1 LacI family DNA-binding transcriptional regulator [Providencia stuartii]ELR5140742.1 LacI family DNA-binding transcriptional regulator [Providencia st